MSEDKWIYSIEHSIRRYIFLKSLTNFHKLKVKNYHGHIYIMTDKSIFKKYINVIKCINPYSN